MVIELLAPVTLDRARFNAGESLDAPEPVATTLIARGRARKALEAPPADKLMRPASRKSGKGRHGEEDTGHGDT